MDGRVRPYNDTGDLPDGQVDYFAGTLGNDPRRLTGTPMALWLNDLRQHGDRHGIRPHTITSKKRTGIIVRAISIMPVLFFFSFFVLALLFGPSRAVNVPTSVTYGVPQIILHTMTLWPLWLCGYIGPRDDAAGGPHETMPNPEPQFAQ